MNTIITIAGVAILAAAGWYAYKKGYLDDITGLLEGLGSGGGTEEPAPEQRKSQRKMRRRKLILKQQLLRGGGGRRRGGRKTKEEEIQTSSCLHGFIL